MDSENKVQRVKCTDGLYRNTRIDMTDLTTINTLDECSPSCITFGAWDGVWMMKLEKRDGVARILFNRDVHPEFTPDDFAQAVIEILERAYITKDLN